MLPLTMASPMTDQEENSAPSTGLGQSTPLVTVQPSAVHGAGIRPAAPVGLTRVTPPTSGNTSTTTAAATHPLEVPPQVEDPLPSRATAVVPTVASASASASSGAALPTTPPRDTTASVHTPPPPLTPPPLKAPPSTTSLDALADSFLSGPSYRTSNLKQSPLFRPPPLPENQHGLQKLRTLVERRAWGDVLQITSAMLRTPSSPHAALYASLMEGTAEEANNDLLIQKQETVELMTLECHAWHKLRRYSDLGQEIETWKFVSFNNPAAVSPLWVPWSLHILAAETLQYTDPNSKRCIDVLNTMRRVITEKNEPDKEVWLASIDHALANAFLRMDEYRLALSSLDDVLESLPEATKYLVESRFAQDGIAHSELVSILLASFRCEVWSRQARIMLQAGALGAASVLFEQGRSEWNSLNVSIETRRKFDECVGNRDVEAQILLNDGLLCFAHGDYDKSMALLSRVVDQLRSNQRFIQNSYRPEDWMGGLLAIGRDSNQSIMTDACNNMALCALYTCRMHEAVRMIESLIREDPTNFFTEGLASNLSTLYELGADQPGCTRKKRVLQLIAKRFYLHDVGPESFRLT